MFKGILYLAIFTATVVASWMGFSVYHGYTTSTISSSEAIIITPISAGFDREVIEKIKTKKIIKVDLNEETVETDTQATESATQTQQATESAQL